MKKKKIYIVAACALFAFLAVSCAQSVSEAPAPATAPSVFKAVASVKHDLLVGDRFFLDGSGSTDPNGTIVSWEWDLGNGRSANGKTTRASYDTAGTYTITLTVTDDNGATAKDSLNVNVKDSGVVTVEVQ